MSLIITAARPRAIRACGFAAALVLAGLAGPALAQALVGPPALAPVVLPDGQHDFDFEFGAWKAHLKRRLHPLTGSDTWVELDGTSVVRKVWGGRANLGEFEVGDGASHIQGISLRLYNPQSHQWSVTWANAADGGLTTPLVGQFHDGRGEFFSQDTLGGKSIFVRIVISDLKPDTFRLEQAFSPDAGKTWEANWIATFVRERA